MGAKALCQVVLGPWQRREIRAVQPPWPVAARAFQAVGPGRGAGPSGSPVPPHGAPPAAQTTFDGSPGVWVLVGEDMGRPLDPGRGHPPLGPQRGSLGQASWEEGLPPDAGRGQRPLFVTRSRRWEVAVSRSGSVRLEAARGGWPASGRARRTARQ